MYVAEESDSGIVPMNHSNKIEQSMAEGEEGRPLIKENTHQASTRSTQSGARVSQGLAGVRKAAREHKEKFTALLHHVTIDLLRDSFGSLKRKAAPGVDGVTWQEYEAGLEDRLVDLHSRLHRGAYRALPSRRVFIEKGDGRKRPLGIAALEDKIVQHAVVTILNQIYEEDFLGFSYGFRPGRSQHQALDALSYALVKRKVNYVLDADIQGFFDNLDKAWMIKFVEHRVADRRTLRLIQKWLKAGVMEEGKWSHTETGTPQGSVISPLLANIYLHYVFDLWVDVWRKKYARGEVIVIRYADDIVLGFQWGTDADRFRRGLGERLGKFGLELHPDKTRRIEFGRYAEQNRKRRGEGKPETFDFLGFTHIIRKNGNGSLAVRRMTVRKRMRKKRISSSNYAYVCMIQCPRQARGSGRLYRATSTTTLCRGTSIVWGCFGSACFATGGKRFSVVVKYAGTPGFVVSSWSHNGFLHLACSLLGPLIASPPVIRDKSRMR